MEHCLHELRRSETGIRGAARAPGRVPPRRPRPGILSVESITRTSLRSGKPEWRSACLRSWPALRGPSRHLSRRARFEARQQARCRWDERHGELRSTRSRCYEHFDDTSASSPPRVFGMRAAGARFAVHAKSAAEQSKLPWLRCSTQPGRSRSGGRRLSQPASVDPLDLPGPPGLVEPWFQGAVEPQHHPPPFAWNGLHPVRRLARGRL